MCVSSAAKCQFILWFKVDWIKTEKLVIMQYFWSLCNITGRFTAFHSSLIQSLKFDFIGSGWDGSWRQIRLRSSGAIRWYRTIGSLWHCQTWLPTFRYPTGWAISSRWHSMNPHRGSFRATLAKTVFITDPTAVGLAKTVRCLFPVIDVCSFSITLQSASLLKHDFITNLRLKI